MQISVIQPKDQVPNMKINIRAMNKDDIDAMMKIQAECYPSDLQEPRSVVVSRYNTSPQQCFVAEDDEGACAYVVGYLSTKDKVTPLDANFSIPQDPDCIYLHDMAVSKRASGMGIATKLAKHLLQSVFPIRDKIKYAGLVSVQESHPFWNRLGYEIRPLEDQEQQDHLKSYQIPAVYMRQTLSFAPNGTLLSRSSL